MLNKLKLGPKMIAAFVLVALVGAVVGFSGLMGLGKTARAYDEIASVRSPSIAALYKMSLAQQQVMVGERGLINRQMMDPALRKAQYEYIDSAFKLAEEGRGIYEPLSHTPDEAKMWKEFTPLWDEWKSRHSEVRQLQEEKDKLIAAGVALDDPRIRDMDDKAFAASLAAREAWLASDKKMGELLDLNQKVADESAAQARAAAARARVTVLAFILLGVLLSVVLGVALTRNVTIPMARGVQMMQELSKGHLGIRLRMAREDEIGVLTRTMDEFAENLQKYVVGTMRKIADGDFTAEVPATDNADEIAPALQATLSSLRGLEAETRQLAAAAVEGRLDVRGEVSQYRGTYREIVEGINETLDSVLGPIQEAAAVLDRMAARDLSARVTGDYRGDHARIKNALNAAADNLDQALQQVNIASEQVASAANQISSGSQAVAQGASEQASALEETSSGLQEMASMTKQNAANAQEARGMTDSARAAAERGVESMRRLSDAIDRIKASSDETAKIVKTIDEIAFQTNLLALNAAVEAARAGDAGKGFAVVAEEVRNLAMRSAEAAKNTANLIDESVSNAESGVAINQEVYTQLQDINDQVRKVGEFMEEIAAASEQQSQGIAQLNVAIGQMEQVTQQNAANSEESASAAEELSGQAEELRGMVGRFQLTGGRSQAPLPQHSAAPRPMATPAHGPASHHPGPDPRAAIPLPGDNGHGSGTDDHVVLHEF